VVTIFLFYLGGPKSNVNNSLPTEKGVFELNKNGSTVRQNAYKSVRIWPQSINIFAGSTPLHFAVRGGHVSIVERLLAAGANVNAVANDRSTPLHYAAKEGHDVTVEWLLAAGANVNAVANDGLTWVRGLTPLHFAVRGGHDVTVERLLAAGADVNAVDSHGSTPLHFAVRGGHDVTVERLLAAGADVNAVDSHGSTPLHFAAKEGHDVTVERLLAAGAKVDAVNNDGMTPYQLAESKGHKMVLGWLNPVYVTTMGGTVYRCNSHTIGSINNLKEEAQRKLGIKIAHLTDENGALLSLSDHLGSRPAIQPGITLTAVDQLPDPPSDQRDSDDAPASQPGITLTAVHQPSYSDD